MKQLFRNASFSLILIVLITACKNKQEAVSENTEVNKEPAGYALERQRIAAEDRYDKVSPYSEGMAIVTLHDSMGVIDADGKEVVRPMYPRIQDYSEGLALVTVQEGIVPIMFIDKSGKKVLDMKVYSNAFSFHNGYSVVSYKSDDFGLMDKAGKLIIPSIYENGPEATSDGTILLNSSKGCMIVDGAGKPLSPTFNNAISYDEDEKLYITTKEKDKLVYIDKTGKELKPYPFSDIRYAFNGVIAMPIDTDTAGSLYGYVSKSGKVIVPYGKYYSCEDFSEGLARVGKKIGETKVNEFETAMNEVYGFVDTTGKEVVACQYDIAGSFSCSRAMVEKSGKYGFIDKAGKEIIPIGFAKANDFQNGYAKVWLTIDGLPVYIDTNGKQYDPILYQK